MSDSCILVKMCVVPNKVSNAFKTGMFIYMYTTFRELLTAELESVGIRLNKRKPNIYFKVRHKIIYDKFKLQLFGQKKCGWVTIVHSNIFFLESYSSATTLQYKHSMLMKT